MLETFVAAHSYGHAAKDKIFAAAAAAQQYAAVHGSEATVNGTIGAIQDEQEQLVCLPTVEQVFRSLPTTEIIAYAPIAGLPDFRTRVQEAAFGASRPQGVYTDAVGTCGGSGSLHHVIWNYTSTGDTVLTSDWFWTGYSVLADDMGRKLETYKMLTDEGTFNLSALEDKVRELLRRQEIAVVIINTPAHNPTGYSLTRADMDGVVAALKRVTDENGRRVVLVLDVAYIDFAGEKDAVREVFRAFDNLPEHILGVVAYSMSKGFTMYGQRVGAMIGVSSSKAVIEEFLAVNQYTSRGTWSNINRACQRTLANIYGDPALLAAVTAERDANYQMIKARADLFTQEADACGLKYIPYMAGFFLSIPSTQPDAVCERLHEDGIFIVPLKAGIRVALCSIPLRKIGGMAAKIKARMVEVEG